MSAGQFFQNVAMSGNDSNDGLSWATPKATIEAALAALPVGGLVLLAPGDYSPKDTLVLNGHHISGMCRSAGSAQAGAEIVCGFPGKPLILFAHGGQLTNVALIIGEPNTGIDPITKQFVGWGDAMYCVSPPFASVEGGSGSAFVPSVPPGAVVTFGEAGAVQTIIGCQPCTGFSPGGGHIAVDNEVFAYSGFTNGVFAITARAVGGAPRAAHAVSPVASANTGAPISQATVLTESLSPADVTASVG